MPESALKRTIDFTGVGESRQPSAHVPAGDYLLEVESVEIKASNNGPWENANWQFSLVGHPGAGVVYENTTLKPDPKALFRLRDLLAAFGMKAPTSRAAIDFAKFIGKKVGATLVDNEYEKENKSTGKTETKTNSKVGTFFPASRLPAPGVVTTIPANAAAAPAATGTGTPSDNGHAAISGDEIAASEDEVVEELEFVDEAI